jgi:hypothetical protein
MKTLNFSYDRVSASNLPIIVQSSVRVTHDGGTTSVLRLLSTRFKLELPIRHGCGNCDRSKIKRLLLSVVTVWQLSHQKENKNIFICCFLKRLVFIGHDCGGNRCKNN